MQTKKDLLEAIEDMPMDAKGGRKETKVIKEILLAG